MFKLGLQVRTGACQSGKERCNKILKIDKIRGEKSLNLKRRPHTSFALEFLGTQDFLKQNIKLSFLFFFTDREERSRKIKREKENNEL